MRRNPECEHAEPIFTSLSFLYESVEDAAAKFAGGVDGNVYSCITNTTVSAFEERLAALKQGQSAVATASGTSAMLGLCLTHPKARDHVLCSRDVFGATVGLFQNTLQKFGVEVSFATFTDSNQWCEAVAPSTRMLLIKAPSNPLNAAADIAALPRIGSDIGAILAVDNRFCWPSLQTP